MPVNFPNSPSNDDEHSANGLVYKYNSTKGAWKRKFVAPTDATDINQLNDSSGLLTSSSTNVVADMAALIAVTGMSNGDLALVSATNNMYAYNGTGWWKIATLQNDSPTTITGVNGLYSLESDGTPTVITAVSTDPEGFPLTWSYAVTSGSLGTTATVSQNENVFTITPGTNEPADAGTFTLTFSVTDGINIGTSNAAFSLSFVADWSIASQQAKIVSTDLSTWDYFGYSTSISEDGNTAVVGAKGDDTETGSAYIFTRSGTSWSQQAKLTASDAATGDHFGWSVGISGDGNTAIVAAISEATGGSNAGAIYIFTRSGTSWSQQAKLQSSDVAGNDWFGASVSLSEDGNTAIASTPWKNSSTGAAYIFTRSGTSWSQQTKLTASDAASDDWFGYSVSISDDGNTAVVGAPQEGTTATYAGSSYIFTRSGTSWSQQAKIQGSDASYGDKFGWSVSISGDGNTAIVGAREKGGGYGGTAYIFTKSGTSWSQQTRINAYNFDSGDQFGHSVSISQDGNIAIVGSITEDSTATDAGSVYIYSRSGISWSHQKRMQNSDSSSYNEFGYSVSMSGDGETAIASSPNVGGASSGAAYILVAG